MLNIKFNSSGIPVFFWHIKYLAVTDFFYPTLSASYKICVRIFIQKIPHVYINDNGIFGFDIKPTGKKK